MTTRVTPMTPPPVAPARSAPAFAWPLRDLVKKIITGRAGAAPHSTPPTQRPFDRAPQTIDGIDSYAPDTPVWAFIGGAWLAATVADPMGTSAVVTYTLPGSANMMVETVHPAYLQLRDQHVRDNRRSDTTPQTSAFDTPHAPGAGPAGVILGMHCPDEHGMCTACADLAHFCWAPCPQARQAMAALGIVPVTQFRGP